MMKIPISAIWTRRQLLTITQLIELILRIMLTFFNGMPTAKLPVNTSYFTGKEVSDRLKPCDNTAPGPDGFTYNHLKRVDPDAVALTPLYNICLKFCMEKDHYNPHLQKRF